MKKFILISIILIVGCDKNSTEPSYTTCYLPIESADEKNDNEGTKICTEELTEMECYEYVEYFDILPAWSSTSSCSELGVAEIIDLCAEVEIIDTNHCDFNWYCAGDCEFELAQPTETILGCMLSDSPNYNPTAVLPCRTECVNDQTGDNCCCE